MAYSAGFSPHPKISYVGAAPTGAASEAEYLEIGLAAAVEAEPLRLALDAALPVGLDVLEVVPAGPGSLAERIEASTWRIELPGIDPERADAAVTVFLAQEHVTVERLTKTGRRELDARAAVVGLRVSADPDTSGRAILELVVRQVTPAVRPEDVLTALRAVGGLAPADTVAPAIATRLAQGPLSDDGSVGDPLAVDRVSPS